MNSKLNNKLTNRKKDKKAFTIIEVVLVLAIAGLIFLIVFLALPGLQRSRRDTQRKSDFNNMTAALENAASNNGGKYPASLSLRFVTDSAFLSGFSPSKDPQGATYVVADPGHTPASDNPTNNQMLGDLWYSTYTQGGSCDSNNKAITTGGSGNAYGYAISMQLEGGDYVCHQVP